MAMKEKQLALFEDPPQRRRRRKIDPSVVEAIGVLRRRGCQVYAAGRDHQVDGKLLSTAQLLALAGITADFRQPAAGTDR
jgi:hypothetical protein